MLTAVIEERPVAKKRTEDETPKRYGTLIRVSDVFSDAIRQAASFEKISIADFATKHLLPVVERRYRDSVVKEARRIEGKS